MADQLTLCQHRVCTKIVCETCKILFCKTPAFADMKFCSRGCCDKGRSRVNLGRQSMSIEARARLSSKRKGFRPNWDPEKRRIGMSIAVTKQWANGKVLNVRSTRGRHVVYRGVHMRSMLEESVAIELDRLQVDWQYEPQRFDLGSCTYLPDFYLTKLDKYIEVKGYEQGLEKVDLFREAGYKVDIVRLAKEVEQYV